MKRAMMSVLGWTALGFTLSWGLACGNPSQGPDADGAEPDSSQAPSAEEQASQSQTDECAGAQGVGTYKGYTCPIHNLVIVSNITCAEARQRCVLDASANPGHNSFCTWNDQLIYRKETDAGMCNSLICQAVTGVGPYKGYTCPSYNTIFVQLSSCQSALSSCEFNARSNPNSSVYCTWKGTEIYRREKTAGACPR